jgi:hypothetical protein
MAKTSLMRESYLGVHPDEQLGSEFHYRTDRKRQLKMGRQKASSRHELEPALRDTYIENRSRAKSPLIGCSQRT